MILDRELNWEINRWNLNKNSWYQSKKILSSMENSGYYNIDNEF